MPLAASFFWLKIAYFAFRGQFLVQSRNKTYVEPVCSSFPSYRLRRIGTLVCLGRPPLAAASHKATQAFTPLENQRAKPRRLTGYMKRERLYRKCSSRPWVRKLRSAPRANGTDPLAARYVELQKTLQATFLHIRQLKGRYHQPVVLTDNPCTLNDLRAFCIAAHKEFG